MKRLLLITSALLFFIGANVLQAQTSEQPWSLDMVVGSHSYDGDLGNEMFGTSESDYLWGMGLSRYLSSSFDVGLQFSKMELDFSTNEHAGELRGKEFSTDNLNMNLMGRFKFNNGAIIREDIGIKPYLMAGLGVNFLKHENGKNSSAFEIPFGGGVQYELSEKVGFKYEMTYHRTFSDEIDTYPSTQGEFARIGEWPRPDYDGKDHDDFLTHTFGIVFRFGGEDQMSSREQMHRQMMNEMQATRRAAEDARSASSEARKIAEENRELSRENVELNEETLQALEELKEARGQTDRVSEELRDMLLSIINNIHFEYDEATLLETSLDQLDLLAQVLQDYPSLRVRIEGHADSRGSEEYNMDLSEQRAESVREYLVNQGISENRLETVALGENSPVLQGDSETVHAMNRYVRLVFSYAGESN